jgi:hypothetical protein
MREEILSFDEDVDELMEDDYDEELNELDGDGLEELEYDEEGGLMEEY